MNDEHIMMIFFLDVNSLGDSLNQSDLGWVSQRTQITWEGARGRLRNIVLNFKHSNYLVSTLTSYTGFSGIFLLSIWIYMSKRIADSIGAFNFMQFRSKVKIRWIFAVHGRNPTFFRLSEPIHMSVLFKLRWVLIKSKNSFDSNSPSETTSVAVSSNISSVEPLNIGDKSSWAPENVVDESNFRPAL